MPLPPTVAVDLRALVPAPTGIGVYTRSLLLALAARHGMRYVGMAHRPPREAGELASAGIGIEHHEAPLGVLWQQLRLPRRLVTISAATARDLAFHFPQCAEKVRVVYPGIDPEFRPGTPEQIAATRRDLATPEGYIFYAGTLEPRKNVGALIDAWEVLRAEDPQTPPLVLAGPYGWGSERLARRIAALEAQGLLSLGRVERSRLVRLFQAARVFVYPSLYEGFGFPAAEALACGVPVVVSNASSLPEVVGDAGLLADAGDAGALAAHIQALLANTGRAAELAARGIERASRFLWDRAAREMEEVFREALG